MERSVRWRSVMNMSQSLLILGLMAGLFALTGLLIGGTAGLVLSIATGAVILMLTPRVAPAVILRMYGARRIDQGEGAGLYTLVGDLSRRAGLTDAPALYYIPSLVMNAFTVGRPGNAAIALTDGILRSMSWREMTGILAHEISHIQHDDLRVMSIADSLSRLINVFAFVGLVLLIFYLPVIFSQGLGLPLAAIAVLIFSPHLSVLLQMALSRTREFDADLNAARITGDPEALASALGKVERLPLRFRDLVFLPGHRVPGPSSLRTHPHTSRRVERLLALAAEQREQRVHVDAAMIPGTYPAVDRRPRWNISGLWY